MKRIILVLALLALLALLLPQAANAQTWDRCYSIPHGQVCVARAAKVTRISCDWGWQPRFSKPPRCVAMGVQP